MGISSQSYTYLLHSYFIHSLLFFHLSFHCGRVSLSLCLSVSLPPSHMSAFFFFFMLMKERLLVFRYSVMGQHHAPAAQSRCTLPRLRWSSRWRMPSGLSSLHPSPSLSRTTMAARPIGLYPKTLRERLLRS